MTEWFTSWVTRIMVEGHNPCRFPLCKAIEVTLELYGVFCILLGQRFGTSKAHLRQPVAYVAVCSKAAVLLLLIVAPIVGFCVCSMFCYANRFVSFLVLQLS